MYLYTFHAEKTEKLLLKLIESDQAASLNLFSEMSV